MEVSFVGTVIWSFTLCTDLLKSGTAHRGRIMDAGEGSPVGRVSSIPFPPAPGPSFDVVRGIYTEPLLRLHEMQMKTS